ncbi:NAD(P)/FAD-dependent oxidoreductase [Aestuariivirga sp.]|uniref:NAD(P)/FAD-dependent oxidoreductase n=1 Tax=Aestuariivirga sp. TaxID=2650926 RepID=UPI003BAB2B78
MAFGSSALSSNASLDPYWWRAAPHEDAQRAAPPKRTDVAIVGSGITGLTAAIALARGGRQVTVFEAKEPGHGASTRNAGYVGRTLKHSFGEIMAHEGLDKAKAVYGELMEAFLAVKETVDRENIDCHYKQQGRLLLATSSAMREAMAREFTLREKHLGERFQLVSRADQHSEIASDHYFGGVRIADHAGLHPGLYHKGLLDAARAAGVGICAFTPVLGFRKEETGFTVFLKGARTEARDLVFATNGYGGREFPWLQRRIMPFHAYQAVSAPMSENRVRALLPGDRTFIDWNFNVDWMRIAPGDNTRITFGGLTGEIDADLRVMGERLKHRLVRIFPEMGDLQFDHVWTGKCGGTFDITPRIGRHEGVYYGSGYCFAGVPMGTLFGKKIARRILGGEGGDSVFDTEPPSKFWYRGNAWFVPYALKWMSRNDR